jgi:hypothetical protein
MRLVTIALVIAVMADHDARCLESLLLSLTRGGCRTMLRYSSLVSDASSPRWSLDGAGPDRSNLLAFVERGIRIATAGPPIR